MCRLCIDKLNTNVGTRLKTIGEYVFLQFLYKVDVISCYYYLFFIRTELNFTDDIVVSKISFNMAKPLFLS